MSQNSEAKKFPKNGILSGMIITIAAGILALLGGFFSSSIQNIFQTPPNNTVTNTFLFSLLLMTAHKIESYFTHEYDVCPVYLTNGGENPRQSLFLGFVPTFLGLSFVAFLLMKGPPWPMLLIGVWIMQGLHETHHLAKSFAQRRYYSGTVSSLFFVAHIALFLLPAWYQQLKPGADLGGKLYAVAIPLVFAAFLLEHRKWLKDCAVSSPEQVRG